MILTRINPRGMTYQLSSPDDDKTTITTGQKKITVNHPIESLNQGWFHWMNGKFVQNAFPFLTADEREFLITGLTPEEWKKMFPEE